MKKLTILLDASAAQLARLVSLQAEFSRVCNALVPTVRENRCWNRVTLHHLAYRGLREQFPQMGSQMVCNAIYSVSRSCRMLFQHPGSPWHLSKLGDRPLPMIGFSPTAPVYFDRHTLSIKQGRLSMYTLEGRVHFNIQLTPGDEAFFHAAKLREVVLSGSAQGATLIFHFSSPDAEGEDEPPLVGSGELPEYLLVMDSVEAPVECPANLPVMEYPQRLAA